MSQRQRACCCIVEEPPPPIGCDACLTNLPTSIRVVGQLQFDQSFRLPSSTPASAGCGSLPNCPFSSLSPNSASYRITVSIDETLYRYDPNVGLNSGCHYYPEAGIEEVFCESFGFSIPGCKVFPFDYSISYPGVRKFSASSCEGPTEIDEKYQWGVCWVHLYLSDNFSTSSTNRNVGCACWTLEVHVAGGFRRFLDGQCLVPNTKRTDYEENGYVIDSAGGPYIVSPVPIARVQYDELGLDSCVQVGASTPMMFRQNPVSNEQTNGRWNRSTLRGRYNISTACDGPISNTGVVGYADVT